MESGFQTSDKTIENSLRRQLRLKQIQFKEPQLDPIEEMISQLPITLDISAEHPLCKLLEDNVKCTQQLADSLSEMEKNLEIASNNFLLIPQGKGNYMKATQIQAELEASLQFHSRCNDPNWPFGLENASNQGN